MKAGTLVLVVAALAAVAFGYLLAFEPNMAAVAVIVFIGGVVFAAVGWKMRRPGDAAWLPRWIMIGFVAKVAGTIARYLMVTVVYHEGLGDSYQYYRAGVSIAEAFANGEALVTTGYASFGTQVLEMITGGFFIVFTPDFLGGFMMFTCFAFAGQIMFYAAFRRWAEPTQLKPYAILIFLLPTYAFWPSSIGKDAIVVFCLGGAAYFIARLLDRYEFKWVLALAPFVLLLGLVRIHIAALVVAAMLGTTIIAKARGKPDLMRTFRRFAIIGVSAAAGLVALRLFPDIFGFDFSSTEGVDTFAADVVRRTSKSGTIAEGGAVTSPLDVPGAIALALFRPWILEANEIQHYFAALETTFLAGLTLWRLRAMIGNWRSWRSNAYLVFCTIYVLGFSIAFSVIRNLGIIARQRGQILALFLVIICAMGLPAKREERTAVPQVPAPPPPTPSPALTRP